MIILTIFGTLLIINRQNGIIRSEELYGKYQFGIVNVSDKMKSMLYNDNMVYDSSVFKSRMISVDEINMEVGENYVDENYVRISGNYLIKGKLPQNNNEIACNMILLYKY